MTAFLESLTPVETALFYLAVFSGVIFVIQFVMTLIGMGDDGMDTDVDADADVDTGSADAADTDADGQGHHHTSFGNIFTIRNTVTFLLGFSLGGLTVIQMGISWLPAVIVLGVAIGVCLVYLNMALLFAISQLQQTGNVRLTDAVGGNAEVTLTIPGRRTGTGKVSLAIQGRLKELHAVTEGPKLPHGRSVTVTHVEGSTLVVE